MIGVPLKPLQTASRADAILKRYDEAAAALREFRGKGLNERGDGYIYLMSKIIIFKFNLRLLKVCVCVSRSQLCLICR